MAAVVQTLHEGSLTDGLGHVFKKFWKKYFFREKKLFSPKVEKIFAEIHQKVSKKGQKKGKKCPKKVYLGENYVLMCLLLPQCAEKLRGALLHTREPSTQKSWPL